MQALEANQNQQYCIITFGGDAIISLKVVNVNDINNHFLTKYKKQVKDQIGTYGKGNPEKICGSNYLKGSWIVNGQDVSHISVPIEEVIQFLKKIK